MNYLTRLGEKIKLTRKSNGMSQQQLAAKSGFDYRYIGFLEKAKINPTIKTLERIARALDVHVCEILPSETEDRERADIYRLSEREMMMYLVMRNLHKADFKKLKAIDKLIESSIKKQPK
jgi:transcriptional regulator with XRE-family HTH domain